MQPLMPLFSREFGIGAAISSLSLSLTTGLLAAALLVAGALSESWGRKPMMAGSLLASALLTVASAVVPGWPAFLLLRGLEGVAFAGLPAITMAYLGEEVHRDSIGLAMGLYIGGPALGGMAGRLLVAVFADHASWRVALFAVGVLGVVAAIVFWRTLPPSTHFRRRPLVLRALATSFAHQFRDTALVALFAEGFLLMGAFIATYNYISYRLLAPPYSLSHTATGSIFAVYLGGIVASTWIGDLAGRLGRRRVFWATVVVMVAGLALTWSARLAVIVAGVAVITFGFFAAHSVASSWVGLRARHAKAQAASLYLFFYYLGASVAGAAGGVFWTAWGWPGVAGFVAGMLAIALVIALKLATVTPLPEDTGAAVGPALP
ncbi:MAG: MFS transporter [Gemmatimonadaceae bacterium]